MQRVTQAAVSVEGECIARIERGLLVLVGVRPADDEAAAERLFKRLLQYRVFADAAGKMNLNLNQVQGQLLLVPQFTLAAETSKGLRPGFCSAAPPDVGRRLFEHMVQFAKSALGSVQCGVFGAHMQVSLTNDGPVTFWLET